MFALEGVLLKIGSKRFVPRPLEGVFHSFFKCNYGYVEFSSLVMNSVRVSFMFFVELIE